MSDRYQGFASSPIGKLLVKNLGLPSPTRLERYREGAPLVTAPSLVGGSGRLVDRLPALLDGLGIASHHHATATQRYKALVFDATGITDTAGLVALQEFFTPLVRRLETCPRVVVLGTTPESVSGGERVAQRALEGFTRSLGKEIGRGGTVQLVHVSAGAEDAVASTLGFLLSPKSAYVSGRSCGSAPTGRRPPGRWPTGPAPSRARSPWSPAPAGASASRSPGSCTATGPPSWASTSPRRPASSRP